jgi:hypothetical protein
MGDVICAFPVRSGRGEKPRRLRLYFDSGSPYTFIKRSACRGFANVFRLARHEDFGGLGNGRFSARAFIHLEIQLLGIWCRHAAYVVDDAVLTEDEDLLVGHDFTQKFNVDIASRRRRVILHRSSLRRAQIVR